ncbi:MAG TPA: hypothetical protein VFW66_13805 [Gemmatimonadales bacterium]|nr:hypothetical protein [Gemmatimonadales bacterium]
MADEPKGPRWWNTLPGMITAVAALAAALSGLLGGLNQLGVLERFKQPAPASERVTAAARDTVGPSAVPPSAAARPEVTRREPTKPARRGGTHPAGAPPARPPDTASAKAPAPAGAQPSESTSAGATTPESTASGSTSPAPPPSAPAPTPTGGVLPSGTAVELAASSRVCSTTSQPGDHFTANVVVPVAQGAAVVLPAGATAILEVTRLPAPSFIGARADSLVLAGKASPVSGASVRIQRELTAGFSEGGIPKPAVGACIPEGGRITVTLTSAVTVGAS